MSVAEKSSRRQEDRQQGHGDVHRQCNRQIGRFSGAVGHDRTATWSTSASCTPTLDIFTYDPGYTSTASCECKITYIDGDKGELLYRGYPIEQLAEKSDFMEVCYLLLNGELPTGGGEGQVRQRPSPITPWCMSSWRASSAASAATRIRWR